MKIGVDYAACVLLLLVQGNIKVALLDVASFKHGGLDPTTPRPVLLLKIICFPDVRAGSGARKSWLMSVEGSSVRVTISLKPFYE